MASAVSLARHAAIAPFLRARVTPTPVRSARRPFVQGCNSVGQVLSQPHHPLARNWCVPPTAAQTSWMVWCSLVYKWGRRGPEPMVVGLGFPIRADDRQRVGA